MTFDDDCDAFEDYRAMREGDEPMDTLYDKLVAAGVPLDHHESDLYAKVTDASRALIAAHTKGPLVFRSAVDGELWFDIPFAYMPWWRARAR